ncbi:MAG: NADH-quinone oxidoreductase subunit B, partial [Aliifodinibius sp.]|nr:NADH-quinone oxidoreductase subunit B [Fodinibius sp.]NIY28368.1 NADH-quinone oxidoreductase subunit B [Fodinibius sp.]
MEKEGAKMDLKLDDFSPEEVAELQRNVFVTTLEQVKGWAR